MSAVKVLAVVLTYCAPDSLADCVKGIGTQQRRPDALLVVDNVPLSVPVASPAPPEGLPMRILRTGVNLGPAGGHARGLQEFLADPTWTHAWVMDDDCVPEPGALAALLDEASRQQPASLVFPIWRHGHRGSVHTAPAWCGFLITRQAVERAGLPREELFWWVEDTEYLKHRMPRTGVAVVRTVDAVVWHWPKRRAGPRPPWQYYYEARNATWYRLHVQRTPDAYRRWLRSIARLTGAALRSPPRTRKLGAVSRGLAHGIRARLGRTVVPPLPSRSEARTEPPT